jgi:hypothetical protein
MVSVFVNYDPTMQFPKFKSRFTLKVAASVSLAIAAICGACLFSFFAGALIGEHRATYDYGTTNELLVESTIDALSEGESESVLHELRALNSAYQPSNRTQYIRLVETYAQNLRGK